MTFPSDAMNEKQAMFDAGKALMARFCALNKLDLPWVVEQPRDELFGTCAYYRKSTVFISVPACAGIGRAGMQWSFPGYVVDRTPYGVIQHELGHHVDMMLSGKRGAYFGDYSIRMRASTKEAAITSYCPNDAEWFAEIFRLFVTNPDLLRRMRPDTFDAITQKVQPVFSDSWEERLFGAPQRTIDAAQKKAHVVR